MPHLFKKTVIASVIISAFTPSYASIVRDDVDYQYFRDLAENKGQFSVGATNVSIYDKNGTFIGTMLNGVSMPDFAVSDRRNSIATLISPQYITSVQHNVGYGSVEFGQKGGDHSDVHNFIYKLVDRNEYPRDSKFHYDYHVPRLNKLVTEVAPIGLSSAGTTQNAYLNSSRFTHFLRVGTGSQQLMSADGQKTALRGAYSYTTAGVPNTITSAGEGWINSSGTLFGNQYGPLVSLSHAGDSGSPVFAYDSVEKKWVLAGVLRAGDLAKFQQIAAVRPEFTAEQEQADVAGRLRNTKAGQEFDWVVNGAESTIQSKQGKQSLAVSLADESVASTDTAKSRPSLNHGKTVYFAGRSGTLNLTGSVNQGAGALYFDNSFTVKPVSTDFTWLGAGISVSKGAQVNWQVKNPEGDRLSKIGEGTLYVNGEGKNLGDISVGDGTVVLAQQADKNGEKQAFNSLDIVSGRPTVVLQDAQQVNPDNIYFGFRGGRLDLNGNVLTFQRIKNVDEGAQLVNHNTKKAATIEINGEKPLAGVTEADLVWENRGKAGRGIYAYNRPGFKDTEYFLLKDLQDWKSTTYFPDRGKTNAYWEALGTDKAVAIQAFLDRENAKIPAPASVIGFNGVLGETDSARHNGELNVRLNPTLNSELVYLFNGGSKLNGTFTVENGTALLSGRHTPHAYDKLNNQDVIKEDDWITRAFTMKNIAVQNEGKLIVGRNVSELNANITLQDNAQATLGFIQGESPVCVRSDDSGEVNCTKQAVLSEQNFANLPSTQVLGDVRLTDQSQLTLGKSKLKGSIQGDKNTSVTLAEQSELQLTKDSRVGNLALANGTLTLNTAYDSATKAAVTAFNQLTVDGDLSGYGNIQFLSNAAQNLGDHLLVNGLASGNFLLRLKNTGKEPNAVSPLSLVRLANAEQNSQTVKFALENGYVDLGAYRYILVNRQNDYRLYSPLREAELTPSAELEQQRAKAQAALQTAEQDLASLKAAGKDYDTALRAHNKQRATRIAAQNQVKAANNKVNTLRQQYVSATKRARARLAVELKKAQTTLAKKQKIAKSVISVANQKTEAFNTAKQALAQAKATYQTAKSQSDALKALLALNEKSYADSLLARAQAICVEQGQTEDVCSQIALSQADSLLDILTAAMETTEELQNELDSVNALLAEAKSALAASENDSELAQTVATLTEKQASLQQQLATAEEAEAEALLAVEAQEQEQTDEVAAQLAALTSATAEDANSVSGNQAEWLSGYSNAALSELSASVNAALQLGQNLDRQVLSDSTSGVWANSQMQKTTHRSANFRDYEQSLRLTQLGVNHDVTSNLQLGAVLSQSNANNQFADDWQSKNKLTMLSLYAKYRADNGFFTALDAGFGRQRTQFKLQGAEQARFHRNLMNVGVNVGSVWELAGIEAQPSLGARYWHFSRSNYELDEAKIAQKTLNLLSYNAGLKLSKAFELNNVGVIFSLASYYNDASQNKLSSKDVLSVNEHTLNQAFARYFNYEAGLAFKLHQWQFATQFGLLDGNEMNKQKYASLKLNYSF